MDRFSHSFPLRLCCHTFSVCVNTFTETSCFSIRPRHSQRLWGDVMEQQQHIVDVGLSREPQVLSLPPDHLPPQRHRPRHGGGAPLVKWGRLCVHPVRPAALQQGSVWPTDRLPVRAGVLLQQDGPEWWELWWVLHRGSRRTKWAFAGFINYKYELWLRRSNGKLFFYRCSFLCAIIACGRRGRSYSVSLEGAADTFKSFSWSQ